MKHSDIHDLIRPVLCENIIKTCKQRLAASSPILIQGLIGITLSNEDVILVNIKSTIDCNEEFETQTNRDSRSSSPTFVHKRKGKYPQKILRQFDARSPSPEKLSDLITCDQDVAVNNCQRSLLTSPIKAKRKRKFKREASISSQESVSGIADTPGKSNSDSFSTACKSIEPSDGDVRNLSDSDNGDEDSIITSALNLNTLSSQTFNPEVCCPICLKEFSNKGNLRRHLKHIHDYGSKDKTKEPNIELPIVPIPTVQTPQLLNPPVSQSPPCTICGKIFSNYGNLRRHMKLHEGENNIGDNAKLEKVNFAAFQTHTCPNCSKEFSTMGNLRRHMKLTDGCRESGLMPVTNKTSKQNYSCDECGKSFVNGGNLKRHQKTHNNQKEFKCTLCDKEFHRRDKYLEHMKGHYPSHTDEIGDQQDENASDRFEDGNEKLICAICFTEFEDEGKLRLHHLQAHAFSRAARKTNEDNPNLGSFKIEQNSEEDNDEETNDDDEDDGNNMELAQ